MAAPAITRITDDAYFELELESPAKHQLWRGVVSSKRRHVELYSREPDGAFRRTAVSGSGRVELTQLAATLPLAEVYEGTEDLMAGEQS